MESPGFLKVENGSWVLEAGSEEDMTNEMHREIVLIYPQF